MLLVHCGQTVGWIKKLLGMEVDLSPGDIVLDADPAPPTERATPKYGSQFMDAGRAACVRKPWPISIVAKLLDGSGYHLVQR